MSGPSLALERRSTAVLPWTLGRYVARVTLWNVLVVAFAFTVLALMIDLIEQLRRTAGRDVSFLDALELAAYHVPALLGRMWPFAVLFGAMLAFWRLNRGNELVVVRAAGVSAWQFLLPACLAVAALGVVVVTVLHPITAALTARYEQLEATVFGRDTDLLVVSPQGIWLRQSTPDGKVIFNAARMQPDDPLRLERVVVFDYDADGRYRARIDAARATLGAGHWQLDDAIRSDAAGLERPVGTVRLATELAADSVRQGLRDPDTLSFWDLPGYIRVLGELGFPARAHLVYFQSLLTTPLFFAAMLITGVSVTLRFQRRGGMGALVVLGLVGGFAFFVLVDVVHALGAAGQLPTWFAALAPSAVALMIGSAVLFQLEDG
ncbi:MAG: LPS export ABC transporter permease LptG [Geminicoccaceae bacterium]|nr:MAG: LPS export ABC transporter permease LptG [Geminicoccaceae bacterium]